MYAWYSAGSRPFGDHLAVGVDDANATVIEREADIFFHDSEEQGGECAEGGNP
jgi:hypothetical protein